MKTKNKKIIFIVGIVIAVILIMVVAFFLLAQMKKSEGVSTSSNTNTIYSFYAEEKNSLEGIYLGSSAAKRYWIPAKAFEDTGACIYNMGTKLQPFIMTEDLIKEALKTQPDLEIIIIEVRGSVRNMKYTGEDYIKKITDAVPYSTNRNHMIKESLAYFAKAEADIDYNSADYYFPMLRKKGAWLADYDMSTLKVLYDDNYRQIDKGYDISFNVTALEGPIEYTKSEPIESYQEEMIDDLLAYCKTIEPEVVFVSAPYESNYGWESKLKYVVNKCEKAGFDTLDFNCEPLQSQLKLDWSNDFADFKHLNVNGALKYTDYLTDYLTEQYELEDHRNEAGYESWHKAVKHLYDTIEANK